MSKEDEMIMVVEREILFQNGCFQGFESHKIRNYEEIILDNIKSMRRGNAEIDPTHKQPIGYVVIKNVFTSQVFAYQRAFNDTDYSEKRLQGRWSWGIGGHIDYSDNKTENPIHESVLRELSEEVIFLGGYEKPIVLGYINDDSNKVGEVHFGILYLLNVYGDVRPKDSEIMHGRFMSLSELEDICLSKNSNVESWSQIALKVLKDLHINHLQPSSD